MRVTGIVNTALFSTARLARHRTTIGAMLAELPDEFHRDRGGGWSFLNACNDRHGEQWADLHATMEQLFMLGVATDQAECQLPRELWSALPGGMPYYCVMPEVATP